MRRLLSVLAMIGIQVGVFIQVLLFNMFQLKQVSLVLILLLGLATGTQVISFTCSQVDTSVCPSGYRYRTQGSYETMTLDSYYCMPVNSTCTPGATQFNLQTCKLDYKDVTCSTGVCFMFPQQPICTTDPLCGTASQPLTYTASYKCDACTNNANCAKCFFNTYFYGTNASSTNETCLGNNCTEGLATANTKISRCANSHDFLGQPCECCVVTQEVSRFCTTNSPPLMQAQVTAWFTKVQSGTLSESKLMVLIGLALLAIIFVGV